MSKFACNHPNLVAAASVLIGPGLVIGTPIFLSVLIAAMFG